MIFPEDYTLEHTMRMFVPLDNAPDKVYLTVYLLVIMTRLHTIARGF